MLVAALFGLFYGIFGVLRLKVYLDIGLIVGSVILLVYSLFIKKACDGIFLAGQMPGWESWAEF